jgi:hypothetical protein
MSIQINGKTYWIYNEQQINELMERFGFEMRRNATELCNYCGGAIGIDCKCMGRY